MKSFHQFLEAVESHTYFHGTSSRLVDKILNSGLIPHATPKKSDVEVTPQTGERLNCVFLTKDYRNARQYADVSAYKLTGHPVVLAIEVPPDQQHNIVKDEDDAKSVRFRGHIPAAWITVHSRP